MNVNGRKKKTREMLSLFLALSMAFTPLFPVGVLADGEAPVQPEIVKTGDPDKLVYLEGELFDLTGFSANVVTSSGAISIAAGDIGADKTDPLTAGDTEITITVAPEGLVPVTFTYAITVNAAEPKAPGAGTVIPLFSFGPLTAGTTYAVTTDSAISGGTLTLSVEKGETSAVTTGAAVTVKAEPVLGKQLVPGSLKYKDITDGGSNYTEITNKVEDNKYTFVMPAHDVVVTASFAEAYSIDITTFTDYFKDDNDLRYTLGIVTTDAVDNQAVAGQQVKLTITPTKTTGYVQEHSLRELTLISEGEEPIQVDILKDVTDGRAGGEYTFTMPAQKVTVDAKFGPYTFAFPKNPAGGTFEPEYGTSNARKFLRDSEDGKYEIWGYLSGTSPVSLAVTAKDGYILKADSAKYTFEDGTETPVPVSDINSINVINSMPKADIVFSADFIAAATEFNLAVGAIANGTVSVDKTKALAGERIKLTVTPNPGYMLTAGSLKYTYAGGKLSNNIAVPAGTVVTHAAPLTITMTMPQTDIVVAAEFGPASIITFDPNIKNGSLIMPYSVSTLSPNSFLSTPGAQLSIVDKPDVGYVMKSGTLKSTTNGGLTYIPIPKGSFTVPDTDATITAEFVPSGSVTAGTAAVDYNETGTGIFEVPITFTTPSSGDVQKLALDLNWLNNAVTFQYIRIGASETKLLGAGASSGTDSATGWVAERGIMSTSSATVYLTAGDVTVNPDADFAENTQYTVYMGLALNPGIVLEEIPITSNSGFTWKSGTWITPINTNGAIKITWTGDGPPFTISSSYRTYNLSKPEHLIWFADQINNVHSTTSAAILVADIDMTGYIGPKGETFAGIGTAEYPLKQTFDGGKKTVTYALTHVGGDGPVGFIRNTTAIVRNLTVNGTITATGGSPDVGLAVGRTSANVQNMTVNGTITVTGGTPNLGGVVGRTSANVIGSTGKATISVSATAGGNIGGIAGLFDNSSTATGSLNGNAHLGTIDVQLGSPAAVVGGIVGSAKGKVSIYSNGNGGAWDAAAPASGGDVQGRGVTGGIVGYMHAASDTTGTKGGNYQNTNFGPVSGRGTAAADSATGGIFGIAGVDATAVGHATQIGSYSSNGYNYLNMNYGSVAADTIYVGGIVGQVRGNSTKIRYSYNAGEVTSSSAQPGAAVGGIIGGTVGGESQTIENNISKGGVKATVGAAVGGLIGFAANPMPQLDALAGAKLNYFAQAPDLAGCPDMPETPGIVGKPAVLLVPLGYASEYNGPGGDGSTENPYQLDNYERLAWFADSVNGASVLGQNFNVILVDNIDISAHPDFVGIGTPQRPYKGVFDGGGFSIKLALKNEASNETGAKDFAALFGYCDGATIQNLTTTGTVDSNCNAAGVVHNLVNGTIRNVRNEAEVTAGRKAAGVLLTGNGVTLKDIVNTGDITSTEALLPSNESADQAAQFTGHASGVVSSLIIGSSTVDNCVNEGNITAAYQAAGVIGSISGSSGKTVSVTNCKNSGTVESLASLSLDSGVYLGGTHLQYRCTAAGIVGWVSEGTFVISACENSGTIKGSGNNVAGILGSVGTGSPTVITVKDCKNSGAIISTYQGGSNHDKVSVGGIIGNAVGSTGSGAPQSTGVTVTGNENTGLLTADNRANVSSTVGRAKWDDPGKVDYESSGNTTNKLYGDDAETPGLELVTSSPEPEEPGKDDSDDDRDLGKGGEGKGGDKEGSGDGEVPSTVPGKGPEAPKAQVPAPSDKPEEAQKIPAVENTGTEQDRSYEQRPASPAEQIDLEERPREETLRVDEATNEEASPEEQPNENSLDVAAGAIERTVENSPFMAVALGVAGVGVLGGGGYALFRLLGRRRLG